MKQNKDKDEEELWRHALAKMCNDITQHHKSGLHQQSRIELKPISDEKNYKCSHIPWKYHIRAKSQLSS